MLDGRPNEYSINWLCIYVTSVFIGRLAFGLKLIAWVLLINFFFFSQVMYIRVKRNKTTYFVQCLPSETVLQIKEKLQELIDQPVKDQRLILIPNQEVLDDSKSLADQKVILHH